MNKRSEGKRRRKKSRSKRNKRCKAAYSQVHKRHPSCKRILGKKNKKSKFNRRRIKDGVVGTTIRGCLNDQEQNVFKNLFHLNANGISELKSFQIFKFKDPENPEESVELNNINVLISRNDQSQYYFSVVAAGGAGAAENQNINYELNVSEIMEYILSN